MYTFPYWGVQAIAKWSCIPANNWITGIRKYSKWVCHQVSAVVQAVIKVKEKKTNQQTTNQNPKLLTFPRFTFKRFLFFFQRLWLHMRLHVNCPFQFADLQKSSWKGCFWHHRKKNKNVSEESCSRELTHLFVKVLKICLYHEVFWFEPKLAKRILLGHLLIWRLIHDVIPHVFRNCKNLWSLFQIVFKFSWHASMD